jgi:hypothetical protein
MFFVFCLPENGHNPPPLSVIEQLNAVDSASERLGIILRVSRLVGAPYVRDAVPMLDLVRVERSKKPSLENTAWPRVT